jgi:Mrr N-terminal domain
MALPGISRLELPILQELVATGGADDVRFLYERLVAYFPQFADEAERHALTNGEQRTWRRHVQRAGRELSQKRQIERNRRGLWTVTGAGRRRVADESPSFSFTDTTDAPAAAPPTHADVQQMLLDIGGALGYHAESEFDYYDVIWRASAQSQRISHVFEVQHKGNVDAALAKLKRAYDAQRTKPFLVVASERDTNRAHSQLSLARTGAFHEIGRVTTVLSFEQLRRLHRALTNVADLLALISER